MTFDDSLAEKIAALEGTYKKRQEGFWHRLWYGIGDKKEIAEAWIGLIPNEYGLAVVKTGIAVLFKVASLPLQRPSETTWQLTKTLISLPRTLMRNDRKSSTPFRPFEMH